MANKFSGLDGSVTISGVEFCMKSYEITESTESVDVTDSCNEGFKDVIPTLREATFTVNAFYDGDNPPTLNAGDRDVPVVFMVSTDYIAHFPKAMITSVSVSVDVTGAVEYTIEGQNQGTYAMFGFISASA